MTQSDYVSELRAKGAGEPVAALLGMRLVSLGPGEARVSLRVTPEHQNFNRFTFGGIIMAIADQAFAYGSNSANFPSVATQFNIHFIAAPVIGDELIAECRVVRSGRRVGISEITVTNQENKLIAKATGTTVPVGQSS